MFAAYNGHVEIIEALAQEGADLTKAGYPGRKGRKYERS